MNQYKQRRTEALKKNAFVLFEELKKSTQEWTTRMTGIQHWKPEHGFDVFVFDPDTEGSVYVLIRRWNESKLKFDEQMFKHQTEHNDMGISVKETKEYIQEKWEKLKEFKSDDEDHEVEVEPKPQQEETELEKEVHAAEAAPSAEKEAKFDNFMDDGVASEIEKEEAWKQPLLRRLATQLKEVEKDHSQFERMLQNNKKRREQALEKSIHTLNEKLINLTEKVCKDV